LGGAANAAVNLNALGAEVNLWGFAEKTVKQDYFAAIEEKKNVHAGIFLVPSRPTT
jgi:bifunctional ADP-heptose synthase (sugar kinase/adenylyltransferase)